MKISDWIGQHIRILIPLAVVFALTNGIGVASILTFAAAVEMEDCRISLGETDCVYTGKAVDPRITVSSEGKALKEGENYELEFEKNVNPGKGKVTITGMKGYRGSVEKTFTIHVDPAKKLKAAYEKGQEEGASGIKLTWEKSACCDEYVITALKKGTKETKEEFRTKETSYTIPAEKFGEYDFTVTAVAGPKQTAAKTAETSISLNPLEKTAIKVEEAGCRSIGISWDPIKEADSYEVTETNTATDKKETFTVPGTENSVFVDEKTAGTTYAYTVKAVATQDGVEYKGPESDSDSATAPEPRIGQASIGETGKGSGNRLGNQNGRELNIEGWSYSGKSSSYKHWNHVLRFKDPEKAAIAAKTMEDCCNNQHVGYDNGSKSTRLSLYYEAQKHNWDCSQITSNCATACSQLVAVCVNAAGISAKADVNAQMMYDNLRSLGEFEDLTDSAYTSTDENLKRGDILVTVHSNGKNNHTCMVL